MAEPTFADGLTAIIAEKRKEGREREKIAQRWRDHEDKLLEVAVEKFKNRCLKEAENQKVTATISFELLTREIPNFPKHVVKDGQYLVDSWGDASAAWWFYATRGTKNPYVPGSDILFAEVIESMMAQFIEYVKLLGFDSCKREAGTWKVTCKWHNPGQEPPAKADEPPAKRAKADDAPAAKSTRAKAAPRSPHTKTPTPTDCPSSDDELCQALDKELKQAK
jgi:hypothetical protein